MWSAYCWTSLRAEPPSKDSGCAICIFPMGILSQIIISVFLSLSLFLSFAYTATQEAREVLWARSAPGPSLTYRCTSR